MLQFDLICNLILRCMFVVSATLNRKLTADFAASCKIGALAI